MGVKRTIVAINNPILSEKAIFFIEDAGFKKMADKWINYDIEIDKLQQMTNDFHALGLHLISRDEWSRNLREFIPVYEVHQGYKCSKGCCLNLKPDLKCLKDD